MSQAVVRPGVGDKVKVVGGDTKKGQEGTIYKDDGDSPASGKGLDKGKGKGKGGGKGKGKGKAYQRNLGVMLNGYDSRSYKIEFSDGKSQHWFEEADVELLAKGKEGKVSIWRSEAWMFMTPAMQSYLGIQLSCWFCFCHF